MNNESNLNPPGMQNFLVKLARTQGTISIDNGVLTFADGTQVDLKLYKGVSLNCCWHCGALMNVAQRYVCGCPKCIEANEGTLP